MSEAKQDDLYRASGYRILTNATVFTLLHDEGRFRMRNSQRLSILHMAFFHIIPSGLFAQLFQIYSKSRIWYFQFVHIWYDWVKFHAINGSVDPNRLL